MNTPRASPSSKLPKSPSSKILRWIVCGAPAAAETNGEAESSMVSTHRQAVPKGCLAVYVGENRERFIIPVNYLSHPNLSQLLQENTPDDCSSQFCYKGGLVIPCCRNSFESALDQLNRSQKPQGLAPDAFSKLPKVNEDLEKTKS